MQIDIIGAVLAILAAGSYATHIVFIRKATKTEQAIDSLLATVWITALVFFVSFSRHLLSEFWS